MKKSFPYRNAQEWQTCLDYLLSIRDTGKYRVTVEKYRKKRSLDANRYYWSCVVTPLAEHTGFTREEMHEELLGSYYGWETKSIRGHQRDFPRRRSTSPETADTMDFMGLIQTGQQIAAELGIILPDQEHPEQENAKKSQP
jgi:hypothetical protein